MLSFMSALRFCMAEAMDSSGKSLSVKSFATAAGLLAVSHSASLVGRALADEKPRAAKFLGGIVGAWNGRAVTTPSGSRPYDMTFTEQTGVGVTATANPGNSRHRWTFYVADGQLHLTFLSTFRGNRTPRRFSPATFEEQEVVFRTKRSDRLTVRIRLTENRLDVNVFRHSRLHVAIELTRGQ